MFEEKIKRECIDTCMYIHTNIYIKIYTIVEIEIGHLKWSLSDKLALCKIWKMHTMKPSLTQRTRMEYQHVSTLIHMLLQWSCRSWYGNHDIIFKTSRSTTLNTLPLHTTLKSYACVVRRIIRNTASGRPLLDTKWVSYIEVRKKDAGPLCRHMETLKSHLTQREALPWTTCRSYHLQITCMHSSRNHTKDWVRWTTAWHTKGQMNCDEKQGCGISDEKDLRIDTLPKRRA